MVGSKAGYYRCNHLHLVPKVEIAAEFLQCTVSLNLVIPEREENARGKKKKRRGTKDEGASKKTMEEKEGERERERERGLPCSEPGGNFKHSRPSNTRIIYDTRASIKQSLNPFVYAGEARHVAALIYGRTSADV